MVPTISLTEKSDLPEIHSMFAQAMEYQRQHGHNIWLGFDRKVIEQDMAAGNQYKITIEGKTACIFSLLYDDGLIWGELEDGSALYLHRIVTHNDFRGRGLFGEVIKWAKQHALSRNLSRIRMDTWADNQNINAYYKRFGFSHIGTVTTPDDARLAEQNRNLKVSLLEMEIC